MAQKARRHLAPRHRPHRLDHRPRRAVGGDQAAGRHHRVGVELGPALVGRRGDHPVDEALRMHQRQVRQVDQRRLAFLQVQIGGVGEGVQHGSQSRRPLDVAIAGVM